LYQLYKSHIPFSKKDAMDSFSSISVNYILLKEMMELPSTTDFFLQKETANNQHWTSD